MEERLEELKKIMSGVRADAYLSNYQESINGYNKAISLMEQLLNQASDVVLKTEWSKCIEQTQKEVQDV